MFEIIGLLFATALLFVLAGIAAAVLGGLTWFLLRGKAHRKRLTAFAVILPFATAIHWWLFADILPGLSLFGDIDEPLPNGYHVTALGKMPDYGNIEPYRNRNGITVPFPFVDRIGLHEQFVFGHLRAFDTEPQPAKPFFLFDTAHDTVSTFASQQALQNSLGRPAELIDLQLFRSPLAQRRHEWNDFIAFGPPLAALALLIAFGVRAWRR